MTRKYDATIILDTRNYAEAVESLNEKVTQLFDQAGATVEKIENLGRKDFVRVTDLKHVGDTYLQVRISGTPASVNAFQESIRLEKQIKRALIRSCK
jgi:small subunit ribosomal protein S6